MSATARFSAVPAHLWTTTTRLAHAATPPSHAIHDLSCCIIAAYSSSFSSKYRSTSYTSIMDTPDSSTTPPPDTPPQGESQAKRKRQVAFYPNMNSSNKPQKPFSRSAAKRESVMALGSIEYLQHYFTKTGLSAKSEYVHILICVSSHRACSLTVDAALSRRRGGSLCPPSVALHRSRGGQVAPRVSSFPHPPRCHRASSPHSRRT